jgi:hypothetical protein
MYLGTMLTENNNKWMLGIVSKIGLNHFPSKDGLFRDQLVDLDSFRLDQIIPFFPMS